MEDQSSRKPHDTYNIAIVDVAAEKGGALSVLMDFYDYIVSNPVEGYKWFFFTSKVDLEESDSICNIKNPEIKKNWFHRIAWEHEEFVRLVGKHRIDLIVSLQNKALPIKHIPQIVYFHNALHFLPLYKFNPFNDSFGFVYRLIVTPITIHSLRRCRMIITQTETMKSEIMKRVKNVAVETVPPSVSITAKNCENTIKGFVYPCGPMKYKNHTKIIAAIKKLDKSFDGEILFTIDGHENRYSKSIAKAVENVDCVRLIGFQAREKILDLYKEYGLIFASDVESFPIPFVEAMAYGSPVISVDRPYAREIIGGYGNCVFFETPDQLCEILSGFQKMHRIEPSTRENENPWKRIRDLIASEADSEKNGTNNRG